MRLKKLGQRIRALRNDRGMSLLQLSEDTGLSKGHLSDIENGKKNMTITTLWKILESLDINVGKLLEE